MKVMNIGALVLDARLQSREEISEATVSEYADAIELGDRFPPVLVYFDGIHYYLTDGYHRYHAHKRIGKVSIEVEVVNGMIRDAIFHSVSVNAKHGMRRSTADKRKAVMTILNDFDWDTSMASSEIARHCGVSVSFVSNLRNLSGKQTEGTIKYKDKDGEVKEKKKAPGRPVKEPELKETAKQDQPTDTKSEQSDAAIEMLMTENEQLKDRLAVEAMEGTAEEKAMAQQTITELREELRIKDIELSAVKASRDAFQAENGQMKAQIKMLNSKIKKLESTT